MLSSLIKRKLKKSFVDIRSILNKLSMSVHSGGKERTRSASWDSEGSRRARDETSSPSWPSSASSTNYTQQTTSWEACTPAVTHMLVSQKQHCGHFSSPANQGWIVTVIVYKCSFFIILIDFVIRELKCLYFILMSFFIFQCFRVVVLCRSFTHSKNTLFSKTCLILIKNIYVCPL